MAYEEHCRTILQFFMLDRVMTSPYLTELIHRVTGSSIGNDVIVDKINQRIGELSQKVLKTTCELTGEKTYVLISTAEQSDIKSSFTKDQIDYFYHVMDNIITSSGSLAFVTALNMASGATMGRVSISKAETFLEMFVVKRLMLLDHGYLYLSSLTLAEFGPYITENYAVNSCILCKKTVVYGDKCLNCSASLHNQCLKEFKTSNKKAVKCLQCKQEWDENA